MKEPYFSALELHEVETQFKRARTLEILNEALTHCLAKLNITTFSFTYYSYHPNSLHKLKYDIASHNFDSWHKHYISENYEEIDSTLTTVYQTSMPIFWTTEQQLMQAASQRERQMRLDSIAFGAKKGLSIPIHGPHEDFAIFLIVQMNDETCLDQWQLTQYTLFTLGYYYYFYIQKHLLKSQEPVEKYNLNKRDIQCLLLIAKHYSPAAMAESLNITERTVNYHIQRLNKKLGTKNKHQSVTKALQKGLIKL